MLIQILLLLLGLVLLIFGADWLVSGASALAKRYRVSDLAIGLTIVAFGTSAPELVVNTYAAAQDYPGIVFGNVIGSNNFNLFIILGIAGLITPLTVQSSTVWKEIPLSLSAALVLFILANDSFYGGTSAVSRIDGALLLVFFVSFLYYVYRQMRTDTAPQTSTEVELSTLRIGAFIAFGLAGLVFGGRLVVTNAVEMATTLGVSEKIIGLTIVAAGTSLPELATSVVAAFKKNNDIAVGNIIGSNIFNLFFILAASALVRPLGYETVFNTDLYLLAGGTLFLFLAMFSGQRKKLDRWEAGLLLIVYLAYTAYLVGVAA